MSAVEVLAQGAALGVALKGGCGRLRFKAPAGALSPALKAQLSAHKVEILDILERERLANRRIVQCCTCLYH
jgi:hypothetical protein